MPEGASPLGFSRTPEEAVLVFNEVKPVGKHDFVDALQYHQKNPGVSLGQ